MKKLKKKKIFVIGDFMIDEYIFGDVERLNPEAPIPLVKIKDKKYSPGGAGNTVANLEALGAEVSSIGSNKIGKKTRIISQGQQILRIDEEDIIPWRITKKQENLIKTNAKDADFILISDYAKGTVTKKLMNILFPFKEKVVIDVIPKNKLLYKGFKYITPNEKAASSMANIKNPLDAAIKLRDKLKTTVILTQGERGATIVGKEIIHIPTKKIEVSNLIGAGDTFIAAFTLALASGFSLVNAVKLANKAGGIAVQHLETYAVKLKDLENED